MKRKLWILAAVTVICLLAALPAMAANVFSFTDKSISLFEGEMAETAMNQDGAYAEGEIVYSSESPKIATVSEDGIVTAVAKGKTKIVADLMQNGKELAELLAPLPEGAEPLTDPVLLLLAGRSVNLSAVCTPEDASNRKITFTSSDVGVAKIQEGTRLRGVEKGECDLVVASVQNPEVQEIYHVLGIEPVKKVQVQAPDKTMVAGEQMELNAVCTPDGGRKRPGDRPGQRRRHH